MPTDNPEEQENYLFNPNRIPRRFSESLFHNPNKVIHLLGLNELPAGTSVLDAGSGNNALVERLKERGINAYGIDIAQPDTPQKPDISAMLPDLPFADNQFDVVINHWGGLSYPLYNIRSLDSFEPNKLQQLQKEITIHFIKQLREAVRVGKQVRIYPWSTSEIFNATGMISLRDLKGSLETGIIPIDFRQIFNEAGITYQTGETQIGSRDIAEVKNSVIILESENVNLEVFDNLINQLSNLPNSSSYYCASDLERNFPDFYHSLKQMNMSEGNKWMQQNNINKINTDTEWINNFIHRLSRKELSEIGTTKEKLFKTNQQAQKAILTMYFEKQRDKFAKLSQKQSIALTKNYQQIRNQLVLNP